MHGRVVYRQSARGLGIAFLLVAVGLGAGGFFVVASAQQDEFIGIIVGVVIGSIFAGLGLAWIVKVLTERVEVSDWGIRMWSSPTGALTFQCPWDEVMSYHGHTDSRINRTYPGIKAYTLRSRQGEMTISGFASYFPELHSEILTRLPATVPVGIPGAPDLRSDAMRPNRSWRSVSAQRFGPGQIMLVLFGALILYAGTGTGPMQVNGREVSEETATAIRIGIMVFGGLLALAGLLWMVLAGREEIRLTPSGVERWSGRRMRCSIPWNEVVSVEALYRFRDLEDADERPFWRLGPRISTYYAVIGRGGRAVVFSSDMEDFGGFLGVLRRSTPDEVIFGTDRL